MYWKEQHTIIRSAWKNTDYRLLLITLYDLLFYGISAAIILALLYWLFISSQQLSFLANLDSFLETEQQVAEQYLSQMRMFLVQFFAVIILAIIVPFLLFTMSRYLIWLSMSAQVFSWRRYWKYTVMHLLWFLILAIPFALAIIPLYAYAQLARAQGTGLNAPSGFIIFFWIVLLIAIYYTHNLYYYFINKHGVFDSLKHAFIDGTKKVHRRIIPGLFVVIVLAIWLIILRAVSAGLQITPGTRAYAITIITTLITLIIFSFGRIYLYTAIEQTR